MSPTQRSLALLRKEGWSPWVVEKWIERTKQRLDAWHCLDILALGDREILGVQATSGSNVAARITKLSESEGLVALRKAGVRVEVHGWRRLAKTGKWECRRVDIS